IQQNVGANDQAAVVLIQTGKSDDNQEFTSDKIALMRSVDKFIGEKIKSKALAVQQDMINRAADVGGIDPRESIDFQGTERASKASGTLHTLTALSNYMSGIRGRKKAVILFSEGIDFNTDDVIGPRGNALPDNPLDDNTATEALHASMILDDMHAMYEA